MSEEAFLRCRGLSRRFGDVVAVDGVDLNVIRGNTIALLGPSGCGKTTLLRLIAGFETPDTGEIQLHGRLLNARRVFVPAEKRRVGMVFQDFALFPHLDVASNVRFGAPAGSGRRAHVQRLLELVGMSGLERRMPHQLSGGQQQRVALARALAAQPDVLLLDEPFSNLDPTMRAKVRMEVRQILAMLQTTAVFVTHDHEEALSIAEQVAVMLDGRILQAGKPTEVYRHPANRAVAEFLGDANILPGRAHNGRVTCAVGSTSGNGPMEGSVQVLIRPEDLALSSEGGVEGIVVSREYYGHDQMITVRLAEGSMLKVRDLPGSELTPGDHIGISLRGDLVLFPASQP